MTDVDHRLLLTGLAGVINRHDWAGLTDYFHPDAILEYPQSKERFRGLGNIRAQFENYPGLEPGSSELDEVIGGTTYALTQMYTVIGIEGSGDRGTAIIRVGYPDGSRWWAVNIYEVRDGRIARSRTFFAPEFEPPDWRAPFRDEG
ncbi:MAG: nuclear transport factor 2 family protein [Candidatus Limnocylindria bacterium]